jgi:hypothetical protein
VSHQSHLSPLNVLAWITSSQPEVDSSRHKSAASPTLATYLRYGCSVEFFS